MSVHLLLPDLEPIPRLTMAAMDLGLILTGDSASDDVALAVRAEQAGLSSVYTCDFCANNALVRLAAKAAKCVRR